MSGKAVMSFKFELLKEFCSFCKDNGIRCYLQGSLLHAAYTETPFNPNWDRITVAVTGAGFLKLHNLINSDSFSSTHPNRALESLLTNKYFPGLYAKYVATDTLHIDFRDKPEWFANKGLAITVLILVNKPEELKHSHILGQYLSNNPPAQRVFQHSYRLRRKAFQIYLDQWRTLSENSGYYTPQGEFLHFVKDFWRSPVYKPIDGFDFPCPQHYIRARQLRSYYSLDTIHSETISFVEFQAICKKKSIDLTDVYNTRREHREDYAAPIAESRRSKRYYNAAFYSTMIRKEISHAIAECPSRDIKNEEYRIIIEEYLTRLIEQSKNGITPYISFDVFLDAVKVYILQNTETFHSRKAVLRRIVNRWIQRIPDSFFLRSPVVDEVCYSERDNEKSESQQREDLTKEIKALLR